MESLFRIVLQMSITAGYVILVVMVLRLLMHRMPKKYSYSLWAVVLFRLCCPITLSSVFSVFMETIPYQDVIAPVTASPSQPAV